MRSNRVVAAVFLAGLAAGACQKASEQPRTATAPDNVPPAATVPDVASSATPPAIGDAKAGASNPVGPMTKQEESTAMPRPGQVNDHSTPGNDEAKKQSTN